MAAVRCVDGSVLAVAPVPVLDRDGVPYEVTLALHRDGRPFAQVGERCGYFLAATAARLRAARQAGLDFPACGMEGGLRAWALDRGDGPDAVWQEVQPYLPRDRVLFSFRSRDPDDLATGGELRAEVRVEREFGEGGWQVRRLACLDAWGERGQGVRALLDSTALLGFLEELVQDFADAGAAYAAHEDGSVLRRPVG